MNPSMTNIGCIGVRAKYIKTEECEKVVVIWLWCGIFNAKGNLRKWQKGQMAFKNL